MITLDLRSQLDLRRGGVVQFNKFGRARGESTVQRDLWCRKQTVKGEEIPLLDYGC